MFIIDGFINISMSKIKKKNPWCFSVKAAVNFYIKRQCVRACHRRVNCIENQILHNSKIRLPRRLVHNSCASVHTLEHSYKLAEHKPLSLTSSSILKLPAKLWIVTNPSLCFVVCQSCSGQVPIVADYIIDSSLTVELIVSSMCSSRTRGRTAAAADTGWERRYIRQFGTWNKPTVLLNRCNYNRQPRVYVPSYQNIYTCDRRSYAINGEPRNRRCVCFMHE